MADGDCRGAGLRRGGEPDRGGDGCFQDLREAGNLIVLRGYSKGRERPNQRGDCHGDGSPSTFVRARVVPPERQDRRRYRRGGGGGVAHERGWSRPPVPRTSLL